MSTARQPHNRQTVEITTETESTTPAGGSPPAGVLRGLILVGLAAWLLSCSPTGATTDGISLVAQLSPTRPVVGTAQLELRLVDADGEAVVGASVAVEANMNHAGMTPTFAELVEDTARPGVYAGELSFTMGGDWFLLVDAGLADGRRIERMIDVPGVAAR